MNDVGKFIGGLLGVFVGGAALGFSLADGAAMALRMLGVL